MKKIQPLGCIEKFGRIVAVQGRDAEGRKKWGIARDMADGCRDFRSTRYVYAGSRIAISAAIENDICLMRSEGVYR